MQSVLAASPRRVENSLPFALGIFCGVVTWFVAPDFFVVANRSKWDIASIYSSVFDISTVFTAFAFTFYSFVLTKSDGFVGRMKGTYAYRQTKRFAVSAMGLGVTLTIASIPMFVVVPQPSTEADSAALLIVALWVSLAVWTIAAFIRAARIFWLMTEPEV